jgi:hypothetical protein
MVITVASNHRAAMDRNVRNVRNVRNARLTLELTVEHPSDDR